MTPDEWLAANTFKCDPLRARITPAQCEINRTREPDLWGRDFRPPQCLECDWEEMQGAGGQMAEDEGQATEAREEKVNRMEESMAKTKQVCLECRRKMYIVARGLCGKCYHDLKKSGELDTKYPSKKAGQQAGATSEQTESIDTPYGDIKFSHPGLLANIVPESMAIGPPSTESLTYDAGLESQDPPPYGTAVNPHTSMCIDFGSIPGGDELHKCIQSEAEKELRSAEMQAMYVLRRHYAVSGD